VYRHGLRAQEAVELRWDQFDLDSGTLHIRRAKGGKDGTHTLDRDELRDLRKLRKAAGGIFVFETERGGPLSVDSLQRIVKEAGHVAGLDIEAHPHMLRHAAGYFLINEGYDVRVAQDYLGHKNIASTAIYTALSPKRLAAVRVR
jgi:integrase